MKGKKIIVPILATAIGASTFVGVMQSPVAVYAETSETNYKSKIGTDLQITGFSNVGHVGAEEAYKLPKVTAETGSMITLSLTSPTGRELFGSEYAYTVGEGTNEQYYNGNHEYAFEMSGDYTLKYTVTKDGCATTTSEEMVISVSASTYGLDLPSNSVNTLPSTIKTGATIRIPMPTATVGGEEEALYSVTDAGVVTKTNSTNKLVVSVSDSNSDNNDETVYIASDALPAYDATSGEYYYEIKCAENGKYVVTYDLYEGSTIKKTITKEFTARADYDIDNMTLTFSAPTKLRASTVTFNDENGTTIPSITVKDANGNTINAYVKIEIKHTLNTDGTRDTTSEWTTVGDDFLYTFDKTGSYQIRYTAIANNLKNSKGVALSSTTFEYTLENLKDVEKPTIYLTEDFTVNENNSVTVGGTTESTKDNILSILGDKSSAVPSTVVLQVVQDGDEETLSGEITLPAFYAYDYGTTYSNMKELVREVINENGVTTTITSDKSLASSKATYKFTTTGEYTIVYRAIDQDGNRTEREFKVDVVGSENLTTVQNSTTNITFDLVDNYKYKTDTITFNAPTASNAYDSDVDIAVQMLLLDSDNQTKQTIDLSKPYKDGDTYSSYLSSGKYTINLEDLELTDVKYIQITATATPDMGASKSISRKITIIGGDDEQPPTIESDTFMSNLYNNAKNAGKFEGATGSEVFIKGSKIYLPNVTVSDDKVDDLGVEITVKHIGTGYKTVYMTSNVIVSGSTQIVGGQYFYANEIGDYEITYIARDNGVNTVTRTYLISVAGEDQVSISVSDSTSNDSVGVGSMYAVIKPTVTVNGEVIDIDTNDDYSYTWEIYTKPEYMETLAKYRDYMNDQAITGEEYTNAVEEWQEANPMAYVIKNGSLGITPKSAGTVGILYKVLKGDEQVASYVKYLTVTSGSTPTMALFINGDANNYETTEDSKILYNYTRGDTITIPEVGFKDAGSYITDLRNNLKISFSNSDGTHKGTLDAGVYELVGQKDTIYTFTYETSCTGVAAMKCTYTVYCGDYNGPELNTSGLVNDDVINTTVTVGGKFNLDCSKLVDYITDDVSSSDKVTITAVLRNSSNISQTATTETVTVDENEYNNYSWTLNSTGTYTLTITLKDEIGNTTTEQISIVCEEETTETSNVGTVVGTVLIVLALLVLAGVIGYFVVTSVRKKGRKTPKNKKKDTK